MCTTPCIYALFCERRIVYIAHMCTHSQEYRMFVSDNVTIISPIHVINHKCLRYGVRAKNSRSCHAYEHTWSRWVSPSLDRSNRCEPQLLNGVVVSKWVSEI